MTWRYWRLLRNRVMLLVDCNGKRRKSEGKADVNEDCERKSWTQINEMGLFVNVGCNKCCGRRAEQVEQKVISGREEGAKKGK